ncbi:uncharacterized protein [Branchiostoma lanceolatum]|uniref:uncharacterized protein n=1 Tax=Branchiostoma lanceolatum TaxID=7740 RepID=UPI0034531D33
MKVYACALLVVVLMAVAKESSAADCKYVGCAVKKDGDGEYFPYSLSTPMMTKDMCIKHCREKGKPFAASGKVRCGCGTQRDVGMTIESKGQCTRVECNPEVGICLWVYATTEEPCEGRRELEILSDLTDTLEKLENAVKRQMGETGDFEEEMREMEDMEADDMFEE